MSLADAVKGSQDRLTDREREVLVERFLLTSATPEGRVGREMAQAREAFAKHAIVKQSEGRWLLRQPDTSHFWFEAVVLAGGHLLVHGDIQAVMFGHYHASKYETPEAAARETVCWMAHRRYPDDSYFVEKARIGGTADETIWTHDDDVLRAEIAELIQEFADAHPDTLEGLQAALDSVGVDSLEETQRTVCEAFDGDTESIPYGRRISSAMVYAHAALQRLASLLDAQP
jgi:hypothetical protein